MQTQRLHFIFPAHPLKPRTIDPTFADQKQALEELGFTTSCFPETVIDEGKPIVGIPTDHRTIYRGWMLTPDQYAILATAIQNAGATPLTSPDAYQKAHHLPGWYETLKALTPETAIFPKGSNYEAELNHLGWGRYFIKDYVKSITTSQGSIIDDPAQINDAVQHFIDYRGDIEGGLCVRRVEDFLPDTEKRYFVLNGQAYSPDGSTPPQIVYQVRDLIDLSFYSVDTIERSDGVTRVVEIGDGQVSDLKEWSAQSFAAIWGTPTQ